jgi:hypothetical protein
MLGLLRTVSIETSFYFVADAYYAAGKVVKGLLNQGHHLLSRVKSNAPETDVRLSPHPAPTLEIAYQPAEPPKGKRRRGAPKRYGKKIKVNSLLSDPRSMQEAPSPVYGERNVILRFRVRDLLWRPAGELVRFVAVIHPARGALLLMCTDLSLDPIDIIRLYGLRLKIEHCFEQAIATKTVTPPMPNFAMENGGLASAFVTPGQTLTPINYDSVSPVISIR